MEIRLGLDLPVVRSMDLSKVFYLNIDGAEIFEINKTMKYITGWQCESCERVSLAGNPWTCPSCCKEICDHCFDKFAHCSECCDKLTETQLIQAANSKGYDFI